MKNMKLHQLAFFMIAFGLPLLSSAQSKGGNGPVTPVRVGSVTLNMGVGVGSHYKGDYYNSGFGTKLAAEWGLWQAGPGVITLGPEVGGSFSSGGHHEDYKSRTTIVAGRSAWHYGWQVKGLDTYGGFSAGLGFHHYEYKNDNHYDESEVIPVFGAFVGASYFVSPTFGFNAEAGYDITNFQVGLIFKLK